MDERFFNHLGPFYQTTPPISSEEKITERTIFATNTKAIDTGIILLIDQVQAMTEAAFFTIVQSRTIGYGKIWPLADYRSRS